MPCMLASNGIEGVVVNFIEELSSLSKIDRTRFRSISLAWAIGNDRPPASR